MLVLSRKQNQRILFPNLGIAIEVLHIAGNSVRVGIDAPRELPILREEVASPADLAALAGASERRHALRNQLNASQLALHVMQRQLDSGQVDQAQQTLERALSGFAELEAMMDSPAKEGRPVLAARTTTRTETQAAVAPLRPRTALLVEDNIHERELLAGLLRISGYNVAVAGDGPAAITYLAEHARPDLVLLDMQLPGMDGGETLQAIRQVPEYDGLKVFAVSGADHSAMNVEVGERGLNRWFSKPLNPVKFLDELNRELEKSSA